MSVNFFLSLCLAHALCSPVHLVSSWVNVFWFNLFAGIRFYSCCLKWIQIHVISLRILLSNLVVCLHYSELIEFCLVETSFVLVRAKGERVSRSACVKHGPVVQSKNCCWPVFGCVHPWTLALWKPQTLNNVLILSIQFANLLGCYSVLLMRFVHPLYTFLKLPTPNLFTVQACLHVSHQLILLICSIRGA